MFSIGNTFFVDNAVKKGVINEHDDFFIVNLFESVKDVDPSVSIRVDSTDYEDAKDLLYNALQNEVNWVCNKDVYSIIER